MPLGNPLAYLFGGNQGYAGYGGANAANNAQTGQLGGVVNPVGGTQNVGGLGGANQSSLQQSTTGTMGPPAATNIGSPTPPPGMSQLQFQLWYMQNVSGGQNFANGSAASSLYNQYLQGQQAAQPGQPGQPGAAPGAPPQPGNNPSIPDAGGVDFNSPEATQRMLELIQRASPGLLGAEIAHDPAYRFNWGDVIAGPAYGGGFGLSGREADTTATAITNIMGNEAGLQTQRSEEATELLRNLGMMLSSGPEQQLGERAAVEATGRLGPESYDALRGSLESQLSSSLAQERNASMNSARDLGLLSQGATGNAALGGIQNRLGALNQQGGFDIERMMEELTGQRIRDAGSTAQQSAQVRQALTQQPALNLAQTLLGPRNPALGDLVNYLQGIQNLQHGEALANRGPSTFETIAPLVGNLIGAGGDIISARQ